MTHTNKKSLAGLVVFSLAILLLSGCSTRIGDLTFVSTKNIDLSDARFDVKNGDRYKGQDCVFSLLGIVPFGIPNLKTAVDKALEAGKGNVMVDEVTRNWGVYFVLGSVSCIEAEGTVLNASETAAAPMLGQ